MRTRATVGVAHKSLRHNGLATFRVAVLQTLKMPKYLIASYLHATAHNFYLCQTVHLQVRHLF